MAFWPCGRRRSLETSAKTNKIKCIHCCFLAFYSFSPAAPSSNFASIGGPLISNGQVIWAIFPLPLTDRNGQIRNYTMNYTLLSLSGQAMTVASQQQIVMRNSSNQNEQVSVIVTGLRASGFYSFYLKTCNKFCTVGAALKNATIPQAGKVPPFFKKIIFRGTLVQYLFI